MRRSSNCRRIRSSSAFMGAALSAWCKANFARVLAKSVRDERVITLQEAIRKLTALPASNLSLTGRGMLRKGYYADIVVFDPKTVQDRSTYEKPHQLATGVDDVWINGVQALKEDWNP